MNNRVLFMLLAIILTSSSIIAQNLWTDIKEDPQKSLDEERRITPRAYRALGLDFNAMKEALDEAPMRRPGNPGGLAIEIPRPEGGLMRFRIQEAPLLLGQMSEKYSDIKTYSGRGIDDPLASIYLDVTPKGFHAMVRTFEGGFWIDPFYEGRTDVYQSYSRLDYDFPEGNTFSCGVVADNSIGKRESVKNKESRQKLLAPVTLRTYRIAIAATGEYTSYHGGTVELGLAAIVTALNRVRGIYEEEVAVSFTLVPNNDSIVYTNGANDPYTNNNGSAMLGQNQSNLDAEIGSANYDVGHVFSTGGGGIASLGVICDNFDKARGVTGLPNPINDPFYVDYIAHEMGHQFAGTHTFNGNAGSCSGGNRTASAAYEPGSGSTIQAYAGICGGQNIQQNSDAYFHLVSLNQITAHISNVATGGSCPTETILVNEPPEANADAEGAGGKYIPARTPFELTGSATDPNNDPLCYNWEQWDLGPPGTIDPDSDMGPLFRSFTPNSSPTRIFPQLSDIIDNVTTFGEALSNVDRELNFQFIVRDKNAMGGGIDVDLLTLNVIDTETPFSITSQNMEETISGTIEVTWDVASTDVAPISCANVDIYLSEDEGFTFEHLLADDVPNDGSEMITVPGGTHTPFGRIKIKCADNVFFDINDANLTIGNVVGDCASTNVMIDNNPIPDGMFISGDDLSSAGTVSANGDVHFRALNSIVLDENFENSGLLLLSIGRCE